MLKKTIYTIGHSTHSLDYFTSLLKQHGISALCDVRSHPYSKFNPQFNSDPLKRHLKAANIAYVFLGKELGARSEDPSCYERGKVQYDCIAQTTLFQQGLRRIQEGIDKHKFCIALMCAEKEPLDCHRTILVARYIESLGFSVKHIHSDGNVESHDAALRRLVCQLKLREHDLFCSHNDILANAYKIQGERIAYDKNEKHRPITNEYIKDTNSEIVYDRVHEEVG